MSTHNRYGLSRHIPAEIRREVRQRSKFGCVICRRGFYQYEHIDPPFGDAREHDPERICCLCGSCHDSVTRGQLSKQMIKSAYISIQELSLDKVDPPIGPLDFHDGNAELLIGGLLYSPAVRTVLRYHKRDLIRVSPGKRVSEPGTISAVFTDDLGSVVLSLEENEWVGSLNTWDIEIVSQRITVRREKGSIVLQLRLDPPGRVVVERLDMRIWDSHVLATDKTYAVGRYIEDDLISWVHASIMIRRSSPVGAVIEFSDPGMLALRDIVIGGTGQELATQDRAVVLNSNAGILIKPLGVAIASLCGSFDVVNLAVGPRNLSDMRRVVLRHPNQVDRFIATGRLSDQDSNEGQ